MKKASPASKALPLGCLIVAFAASLTLFLIRDQRYINTLPNFVKGYRDVSQIIVHLLSSILSMAQVLVVCSLLNFATRIKLFESSTSISNLSFWSALSIPRFDATLPSTRILFVTLMLALGTGLGALWTASLTPLASAASRNDGKILIPFFNSAISKALYPRPADGAIIIECSNGQKDDPRGPEYPTLDNCIILSKLGNLLMTAATATNVTNPRKHPKIDDSTWTYRSRSYGKGSSTGLFNVTNTTEQSVDQGFSYQESGYNINASCSKHSEILFPFEEYETGGGEQLSLWTSQVVMLDSGNVSIPPFDAASPVSNGMNSAPFGYFAWSAFSHNGSHYIATSSQPDSWSHSLDKILCTIEFVPMTFLTNVSKVDRSITVTPLESIGEFDQTGNITDQIMLDLDLLSRTSSWSMTYSSLYNAISTNMEAASSVYNVSNDTAWVLSLRDAIVEVADDLLTYQGILAVSRNDGESIPQPVQRHFAAIKIGQTKYHVAQLVINIVLCIIYLYEAIRTRYWKHLPDFDFLDVRALALAALGPEKSNEGTGTTAALRSFSRRGKNSSTKLEAYYDEKSRPRLRYGSAPGEPQRTTADEQSGHPLSDLGPSRDNEFATQDRDSIDLSDRHLDPLLAGTPFA